MPSVWSENSRLSKFDSLKRDINTDVLIIGGGIAGILCAYNLKRSGIACILVEADRILKGVTANTTAKITYQHGLIYKDMIKRRGTQYAEKYIDANKKALERYRQLSKEYDCDFEVKDNYVYSSHEKEKIYYEAYALNMLGETADFCESLPLPFSACGVRVKNQAQFNPLKLLGSMTDGLIIYESTRVYELIGTKAITDGGIINAKKIIIATHFPFINKHGSYFLKMYQHRSYVIGIENAKIPDGMFVDENKQGLSFRGYKNLLLLGGAGNKTGKECGGWDELTAFAKKYYTDSEIKYKWATQDCMTLDGIPYIGRYSANTPNLFVITGFNKWGMTSAMAGAELLTDLISERKSELEDVFSPSRSMLIKQLFFNGINAAKNLLTPGSKRCPHMGCKLKWNEKEKSWDCPCHGSRFDKSGKLLDNPSTGNFKAK